MAVYDKKEDKPRSPALDSKDLSKREESAGADELSQDEYPHPESDAVDNFFKRDDLVNPNNPEADKYNESIGGIKGKLVKFGSKKILAGGIGAGLIGVFIVIGSFLGFLNVFKLNHIMQNIEARAFSRYQVALDGRSDKWIKSYIMTRLGEIDEVDGKTVDINKRENLFFKANKVDTNNPFIDWYKTLRTSSFEADLLKNYGISFSSIAKQESGMVKFKSARINFTRKDGMIVDFTDIADFNVSDLNNPNSASMLKIKEKYNIVINEFDSNKTARQAIKKAVNEKTHSWQVIKRRHVRKAIQNKTGIRSWRFFDKTRSKVEEKVISVRNKIIKAVLPDSTVMGRVVQCIFGVTQCRASNDPGSPDTKAGNSSSTGTEKEGRKENLDPNKEKIPLLGDDASNAVREAGEMTLKELGESAAELSAKQAFAANLTKSIIGKAGKAINIVSWLDTLNTLNNTFNSGAITKMISVSRGIQAIGLYTAFMTAADQLKTGKVTGEEVNDLMQTLDTASNSEGWTSVISNSSETAQAEGQVNTNAAREEYCSEEYQDAMAANPSAYKDQFAYLCDDKKIGGESTGASIENWWNDNIGSVLGPLLSVYDNSFVKGIMKIFNDLAGEVIGAFLNIGKALVPPSVEDKVADGFGWIMTKVATGVGAGPIMDGNESGAVYANVMIEGAAYSAETSARNSGASITNDASQVLSTQMTMAYYNDYYDSESLFTKYLSLNNPESSLSNSLFATIQNTTVNNFAGIFSQIIKSAAKLPFNIFSKQTNAGTESAFAAANFSGIETYDFPQQCYDLDPLTMSLDTIENAQKITNAAGSIIPLNELTWDIVNNSDAFYSLLYSKLGEIYGKDKDVDEYAKPIYNCAIMDTTVRGGLGYVYGYTNDYGLETASTALEQPTVATKNNSIYFLGNSIGEMSSSQINSTLTTNKWNLDMESKWGRTLAAPRTGSQPVNGVDQATSDSARINQADTIVVELGTNDCKQSSTDFTASLNALYSKLKSINQNATYYWVDYAFSQNGEGCNASDMASRNIDLNTFANSNGIAIISWSSIGVPFVSYDSWGVHPNDAGKTALANLIADTLGIYTGGDCGGLVLEKATTVHGIHSDTTPEDAARLRNHDQYKMPSEGPGYFVPSYIDTDRDAQWGSRELVQTIYQVAKKWDQLHPNGPKFEVHDLDNATGHATHVDGINVDIVGCPFFMACSDYNREYSIELGKLFFETGNIKSILYNDTTVQQALSSFGDMHSYSGHEDHFHVTIMNGQSPLGCQQL